MNLRPVYEQAIVARDEAQKAVDALFRVMNEAARVAPTTAQPVDLTAFNCPPFCSKCSRCHPVGEACKPAPLNDDIVGRLITTLKDIEGICAGKKYLDGIGVYLIDEKARAMREALEERK